MLVRLLKLLIIVGWIPIMLTLMALCVFLLVPVLIVSTLKWILVGTGLYDWIFDKYFDFFFFKTVDVIDKIIEYKK